MKKGLILVGQFAGIGGVAWLTYQYILRDFLFHKRDVQDSVEKKVRRALLPQRVDREVVHEGALILTQVVESKVPAGIHGEWRVPREYVGYALRQSFPRMTSLQVDFHQMGFISDPEDGLVAPEDFVIGLLLVDEGSLALFPERVRRFHHYLTGGGKQPLDATLLEPAIGCVLRMQGEHGVDQTKATHDFVSRCRTGRSMAEASSFLTLDEFLSCSETERMFKQQ